LRCGEGQAVEFVARADATKYDVPQYLICVWDRALAALEELKLIRGE
jgi:hypothetical protein